MHLVCHRGTNMLQPDTADVTKQLGRPGCLPLQQRLVDLAGVLLEHLAVCPAFPPGNEINTSCCCRMQSYINHDGTGAIASIGSELSQIAVADVEEVGLPASFCWLAAHQRSD